MPKSIHSKIIRFVDFSTDYPNINLIYIFIGRKVYESKVRIITYD